MTDTMLVEKRHLSYCCVAQKLSLFLKQPTENNQEDVVLDPDIDNTKLDFVYDLIAVDTTGVGCVPGSQS